MNKQNSENLVTLKSVTKYKGEIDGQYQTYWLGVDKNLQLYLSNNLEYKQEGSKSIIDMEATRWKPISNEQANKIDSEMYKEKTIKGNFEFDKTKQLNQNNSRGLSF